MKDDEKDPYDIKKFEEVLGESYMMIPDSQRRLKKNVEELALFLDSYSTLDGAEWLSTAKDIVQQYTDKEDAIEETSVDGLQDGEAF